MAKGPVRSSAFQFLYVDGNLVGPVKIGETVQVYPDMDLADLAGLHRKRFKTVEDMLTAVRSVSPNAKRLEIRGDHTVIGELFALLDSKRAALTRSSSKAHSAKRTVKAGATKRRT